MLTPAFEGAFEKVSKLAATFQANEASYLSPGYQEAEARKDWLVGISDFGAMYFTQP